MNRGETLTQAVIERLAKEAGGEEYGPRSWNISFKRGALHRFADLIANFCEEFSTPIAAGSGEATTVTDEMVEAFQAKYREIGEREGEAALRQVIFDALDLSEELRIECTFDIVNALTAAGYVLSTPAAPELAVKVGWVLVPKESTPEMQNAAIRAIPMDRYLETGSGKRKVTLSTDECAEIYRIMVEAALSSVREP
ncbi:hypothetical protein [Mesorhizobium sp. B263B2A]|uniref:hypothetical protein n=1 Tax=Mesorhizobium sp. B263B2A TaxID=2876669 RepID=UPI001CD18C73|nr:hypothetical protein [Mesorhizobium sp. B263B2A]MCA0032700.1 hypothetical protein [Mesorhizobium sp. B263B2A]